MTLTTEWINRTYQADDAAPVLQLLQASMGPDSHGARQSVWEWKHLRNPFGPSFIRIACGEGDQVIGLRALLQWQFRMAGRTFRAVRAVDTATHPDFRRLGIFSALTQSAIEDVKEDGVDFIFNTPNQYSMPGYLRMGWQAVGVAQPVVRVLNPCRFAIGMARHSTRFRNTEVYPEDAFIKRPVCRFAELLASDQAVEAVDELLVRSDRITASTDSVATSRSVDFLRWRYAEHPYINYYVATVENGSRLDALAIFRINTRFGLREIVMAELFMAERDMELGKQIMREMKTQLRADYVVAYFREGSFQRRALRHSGFRAVPRGGIAVTARYLDKDLPFDPFQLHSWEFSLGDLELF